METKDINLIKQVTTLVADVKNLKESQDTFHKEMKDSFKELRDNYANRLDNLEIKVQDLQITRTDFREKISSTNKYLVFLSAVGILLVGILIFHLTGYKI